jgi:hypothetical protein
MVGREMDGRVTLTLPQARVDHYLSWMAIWREVEQKMMERPPLAREASRAAGISFVGDTIAAYISTALVPEIRRQARAARDRGRHGVAPKIRGDAATLRQCLRHLEARGRWLAEPGILEAMGIPEPDSQVWLLRERVVQALKQQLHVGAMSFH